MARFRVMPGDAGIIDGLHRSHQARPILIWLGPSLSRIEPLEQFSQGHVHGNRCVVTGVDGDGQDRLKEQSQGKAHSPPAAHTLATAKIVEDQEQGREILFQIRARVARWVRRSGKRARKAAPPALVSSVVCFVI